MNGNSGNEKARLYASRNHLTSWLLPILWASIIANWILSWYRGLSYLRRSLFPVASSCSICSGRVGCSRTTPQEVMWASCLTVLLNDRGSGPNCGSRLRTTCVILVIFIVWLFCRACWQMKWLCHRLFETKKIWVDCLENKLDIFIYSVGTRPFQVMWQTTANHGFPLVLKSG